MFKQFFKRKRTSSYFEGKALKPKTGEVLLDTLLRHGIDIKYSCREGICQSCIIKTTEGQPSPAAVKGLSDTQKALGYLLCCQQDAQHSPLKLEYVDSESLYQPKRVLEKFWLNEHILCLRTEPMIHAIPGQFVNLQNSDGISRSYSLASHPNENYTEFHIKVIEQGVVSSWIANTVNVNESILLSQPIGQCIYTPHESPMLLVGIGTGLAPLFGILKDALRQQHSAAIDLVLGARCSDDFYLIEELTALEQQHNHLNIHWIAQRALKEHHHQADIYDYVKQRFTNLPDSHVYLCGAASFVQKMKRQCFMAGTPMRNILADAFQASQ